VGENVAYLNIFFGRSAELHELLYVMGTDHLEVELQRIYAASHLHTQSHKQERPNIITSLSLADESETQL
jgi:hypothetical protein